MEEGLYGVVRAKLAFASERVCKFGGSALWSQLFGHRGGQGAGKLPRAFDVGDVVVIVFKGGTPPIPLLRCGRFNGSAENPSVLAPG